MTNTLADIGDLHQIQSREGKSFATFCDSTVVEKGDILHHTFTRQPDDIQARAKDNDKTVALLARSNFCYSKAVAYATQARGVIVWRLKKIGLAATLINDVSKAYLADFEEEAGDWRAIIDSLHERLWTGRKDVERENRSY